MSIKNILEVENIDYNKEVIETILKNSNVKIKRIISTGQNSIENFWYNQKENEFILLLQGEAGIEFEDDNIELKKGDYCLIPKYKKHRVSYTKSNEITIWLCIFFD